MIEIDRDSYTLLLGQNPCEIFLHYGVEEMHGLNFKDCVLHSNTSNNAYIWGLANYVPKENGEYKYGDKRFVFINLQRFGDNYETFGGVFHELLHHSLEMHNYNMDLEEDVISWAESESHKVFQLILTQGQNQRQNVLDKFFPTTSI